MIFKAHHFNTVESISTIPNDLLKCIDRFFIVLIHFTVLLQERDAFLL